MMNSETAMAMRFSRELAAERSLNNRMSAQLGQIVSSFVVVFTFVILGGVVTVLVFAQLLLHPA